MESAMPRTTERHATVLNKLQSVIEHIDSKTAAERRLAIERWVKTYIRQVEYLEDDKLQFLYKMFRDESCWSDTKLNNAILGQKLTEEKIEAIDNPFCRYNMACRYCVVDKIHPLFQEQFESYKGRVSPDAVDMEGNPVNDKYIRNDLLDSMESYDPVFSFWIDRESEELKLKEYSNIGGFRKAVDFKWSQGVEYFYNLLSEQQRKEEVTNAVITLSSIQSNFNRATVLDFCLHKMDDSTKRELLVKLSEKDQGVYSLLNGLIKWSFLDTVQDMIKRLCYEEVSVPTDKILSGRDYGLLLSSLSNVILENPELSAQARSTIMGIWRCNRFSEYKKLVLFSDDKALVTPVFAAFITDWNRNKAGGDVGIKDQILEILRFAEENCSSEDLASFKDYVVNDLKMVSMPGMVRNISYSKLMGELFYEVSVSSDLRTELASPGVSGLSSHSK
ncbi:hypothetical protein [Wolbachia pipientis]|nr:hypothetical protein [Wolbachia pipientis]